jgi:hypothetical protein
LKSPLDNHGTVQLHNGQEILHELNIPRAIAQAGGDIRAAGHAKQAEGGVAEGGHDLRAGTCSDAAAVFAERFIADVEHAILNRPMMAVEIQQTSRVGLVARHAGDAIDGLARGLAFAGGAVGPRAFAGDAKDLPDAGPAERVLQVGVQRRGAGECPFLAAAVPLGVSGCRVAFGGTFTLDVGGKRPRCLR